MTGAEFARRRAALGLTQRALADKLGVHRVTLARWEGGTHPVLEAAARLLTYIERDKETQR